MRRTLTVGAITVAAATTFVFAQGAQRPLSPRGQASVQLGGVDHTADGETSYTGGVWIDVDYGRPLLRQRTNIFGSGATYGKTVFAGGTVWRVGANQSTRFTTPVPLTVDGKPLPAGEYSLFIDLKPAKWTLIFSNWAAQQKYDPNNKTALWGAFGYTPDKDQLRVPMTLGTLPFSLDQLTIAFTDVKKTSGRLAVMWDTTIASVPFALAGK